MIMNVNKLNYDKLISINSTIKSDFIYEYIQKNK
jgi:hypothetical protein